ncbi:ABC transporter permease [Leucobacter chinensis]|uniref:ABC transporter permease n=1 Tax=Leucobacter chinensis TaxID=2851010 RepID=UPI001C246F6C
MVDFLVKRLSQALITLFALSIVLFAWLRSLPGGPVSALVGENASVEERQEMERILGLQDPLIVQYWRFLTRAVQGQFGKSTGVQSGQDSMSLFLERFPATLELGFVALIIALLIGIPLGYIAAKRSGSLLDTGSIMVSLVGVAVPVFFLAFLLKYIFAIKLGVLPVSGRQSVGIDSTTITGFVVLDGVMTREWDAVLDGLKHLVLPAIALSSIPMAVIFRITRASVISVMDEDYVRTAEAKGLTPRVIRGRHVLRNGLIPVITVTGLQVGVLLGGAVLTEKVFTFRGVGHALAQGFETRDYAVLQVLILMSALVYIVVNLIVDMAYGAIDPRARVS